jgi:hypothetical protein
MGEYKSVKVREKTHHNLAMDALKEGMSMMDFVEKLHVDYRTRKKENVKVKKEGKVNNS